MIKISDRNNLREEGFILAQNFGGFSPWLLNPMLLDRTSWKQRSFFTSLWTGSRETRSSQGQDTFKDIPQ
jgi:hypothetical protein